MVKARRVLLKLSGERIADPGTFGISAKPLKQIAEQIAEVNKSGVQIAVTIGGGNIWRSSDHTDLPLERATSDYMGMLGIVMNGLALQNAVEKAGVPCRVQSSLTMPQVAEPYIYRRAIRHLEKGRVIILVAGLGQPYVTSDTGAAVRALEIGADVLLKGSKVDGIYDQDPTKNPHAKRFDQLTFSEALSKNLRVMDAGALAMCRDNNLELIVFDVFKPGALADVVAGKKIGTKVTV